MLKNRVGRGKDDYANTDQDLSKVLIHDSMSSKARDINEDEIGNLVDFALSRNCVSVLPKVTKLIAEKKCNIPLTGIKEKMLVLVLTTTVRLLMLLNSTLPPRMFQIHSQKVWI
jgi:hypothetical protein